jgi:hypothetical protein
MYKSNQYTVTLSGYKIKTIFKDLDKAKLASLRFCDKLLK